MFGFENINEISSFLPFLIPMIFGIDDAFLAIGASALSGLFGFLGKEEDKDQPFRPKTPVRFSRANTNVKLTSNLKSAGEEQTPIRPTTESGSKLLASTQRLIAFNNSIISG